MGCQKHSSLRIPLRGMFLDPLLLFFVIHVDQQSWFFSVDCKEVKVSWLTLLCSSCRISWLCKALRWGPIRGMQAGDRFVSAFCEKKRQILEFAVGGVVGDGWTTGPVLRSLEPNGKYILFCGGPGSQPKGYRILET